jgi:2-haloacid dehalogenase
MIRNVVFDIGGVLLDWNPRYLYRTLIPDEEAMERFLAEICTMEWNGRLDAGQSFADACDELAERHPDHAGLIHAWKRQDEMIGGEIAGTADLVRRLRDRDVPLFLLTNHPSETFISRRDRFEVLRLFDGAIVSGDERILKPSREIFDLLTTRFGLPPSETLFIDDMPVNVEGARAAGFEAHRFVDAPTLERALVDLGLLP